MAKAKTSKKPAKFSLDEMPRVARKKAGERWSPTRELAHREKTARALFQCVVENDMESFFEIFEAHVEARGLSESLKGIKVPRSTYYSAKATKDPKVSTLSRLMRSVLAA